MTATSLNYKIAYYRKVIKQKYDSTDREIANLLGRKDKRDMWSPDHSGLPVVHWVDSRNRQAALYLLTDGLRGYRQTRE